MSYNGPFHHPGEYDPYEPPKDPYGPKSKIVSFGPTQNFQTNSMGLLLYDKIHPSFHPCLSQDKEKVVHDYRTIYSDRLTVQ